MLFVMTLEAINVPDGNILYVECEPDSIHLERELAVQKAFMNEVDAILDAQTEDEMNEKLNFRHLVSVAARINPNLKPFQKQMKTEIEEIEEVLGEKEPFWVQWGVFKILLWEQQGPVKFGEVFGIPSSEIHTKTADLSVSKIERARSTLDDSLPQL